MARSVFGNGVWPVDVVINAFLIFPKPFTDEIDEVVISSKTIVALEIYEFTPSVTWIFG